MHIIYIFIMDTIYIKYPRKKIFFVYHYFIALDQKPKIKICYMVTSKHTEVIEGRIRLIVMYVIEPDDASDYGTVDGDVTATEKEDKSGSGETDMIACVAEAGKKRWNR